MDRLKNKNYKQYQFVSRYTSFPYYYNTLDDKFIYGLTAQIDKDIQYVTHKIKDYDTLDNLSLTYYGRPDYYWIIADFNNIQDPYKDIQSLESIKIPTFTAIKYKK
jgi:nucleoid-associated protein YgaU